jgi:AraC family transcriptional regulator
MSDHLQPRSLFRSPLLALYDVDCHAPRGSSSTEEEMMNHTLVFPRSGVFLKKISEKDQLVADSTRVLFFNRHETCRFSHPADGGDKCTSIRFRAEPLVDFLQSMRPHVADSPERPFRSAAAVSTSSLALKLHRLRRLVLFARSDDALVIEETCVALLTEALANAGEEQNTELRKSRQSTRKAHRDLVDATRVVLARRFREKLSLADLARAVFSSPFHLARIFRRETGLSLHQHLTRLRLRHALEHLADDKPDLTMLALDLGFSSHAHFSHAFRREFGSAPSQLRSSPKELRRFVLTTPF